MKKLKPILLTALMLALVLSNVYFIRQAQKPDYEILVGRVVAASATDEAGGHTVGVDFTNAKPLGKEEVSTVFMALITADSYTPADAIAEIPDAQMLLPLTHEDAVYTYEINLWLQGDSILYRFGQDGTCGVITNANWVADLTSILEGHLAG